MMENQLLKNLKLSVFFLTVFLFSVVFVVLKSYADLDLWHRMAVGKIFSQLGWVIYHDIFSYFPVKDMWVDHEWLSGVVFYYLGHYFGDTGILILQIAIVFSILLLVFKTNKLLCPEDKHRIGYYLVVLLAIIPGLSSSLRCQAFTYLFFALWIYLLERIKRGESRFYWVFPITMLLWVNLHGGFLAGIGLIVFYIIGDFLDKKPVSKYLLIIALILPVTLINPYGFDFLIYMADAVSMERPYITEWKPFSPFKNIYNEPGAKILFLFLTAGYGYKLFKRKYDFAKVEVVALLITIFLAFRHERHMMFFAIVAGCYGYRHFVAFLNSVFDKIRPKLLILVPKEKIDKVYFTKWALTYIPLAILGFYLIAITPISLKMDIYPVRAVEFIRINNISGNLFVPFNWGSYAMWKLYQQNLVSIDGRYEESYKSSSYLEACSLAFLKEEWKEVLYRYKHDILLLKADSEVYEKIKTLPEWKAVYEDEVSAVFLPASDRREEWKMPTENKEYYIKTKYENRIDF